MGPPPLTASLFDSNILIDFLNGHPGAAEALGAMTADRAVSIVSWIEVLAGPEAGEPAARLLLGEFQVLPISAEVAEATAGLRRQRRRLKLPDAVILATARVSGRLLVTRDVKAFDFADPGIRIPYRL